MDKQTAIIKFTFLYLLCLIICTSGLAQSSASPFDITPRLPKVVPTDTILNTNPFDIQKNAINKARTSNNSPQFKIERKQKQLSAKEKTAIYERFLLVTIIVMLVILTLVVMVFRIFISKLWTAFLNDNILLQLRREQGGGVAIGYAVLYAVFFINTGIFAYLALKHFGIRISNSEVKTLLLCMVGIAGYFLTKHFLMTIVKSVFPIEKEVGQYNFTVMVFNIITGIFIVPMILFTAYASDGLKGPIVKITIFMILVSILFRGLRGLFIARRFFAWHKFHFLLYLCIVELAPLLFTLKLLNVL